MAPLFIEQRSLLLETETNILKDSTRFMHARPGVIVQVDFEYD
jgi:hypothetical protein